MQRSRFSVGRWCGLAIAVSTMFATTLLHAASPVAGPVDLGDQLKARAAPLPLDPGLDRVTTRGGWINFAWNDDALREFGLTRSHAGGTVEKGNVARVRFALEAASEFEFDLHNKGIPRFAAGLAGIRGGFTFVMGKAAIDWRNVKIVLRPQEPLRLDFVSTDGDVLFYGDSVMYALSRDGRALTIESMDIRVAPRLAEKLAMPHAADRAIGDVQLYSAIDTRVAAAQPKACGDPNWPGRAVPGVPNARYEADVFMTAFSNSYRRCRANANGDPCDGPAAGSDGYVVFAPSSTLSNNRNNGAPVQVVAGDPLGTSTAMYTADIRWLRKFNGTVPPYNNDQHPFLIWNFYRLDSDGRITQIGASGVKHAFVSTNGSPPGCPGCCEGCNGGNVLGISCTDTYGVGNNDQTTDLGPRREILPARGIWGRCGSIYDPNCDGSADSPNPPLTSYDNRMMVRESSLTVPGTFLSESWYIVREDVNIYNTMATRPFSASYGAAWSVSDGGPFKLGPAIDRWVDAAPAGQAKMNTEIADVDGHTKVAVRVVDNGNGTYRYDYAVMNLDFARAETSGAEPNLRVISNRGFDGFSVTPGAASVSALEFADIDLDSGNDWAGAADSNAVTWTVPAANTNTLDWGTLYRFSFTADQPPVAGTATLHVALAGSPAALTAATLVPSGGVPLPDAIFADGYEEP